MSGVERVGNPRNLKEKLIMSGTEWVRNPGRCLNQGLMMSDIERGGDPRSLKEGPMSDMERLGNRGEP